MNATTLDKLEQMLHEGKISEEDYERLSSAAERSAVEPEPETRETEASTRGEFRRSRERAVIGGVCAGLAKKFGWDLMLVRVGAVAMTLLLGILWGIGLLIPICYLVVWLLVPYEKRAASDAHPTGGAVWLFIGVVFTLCFLIPAICSVFILDAVFDIYHDMGMELGSGSVGGFLIRTAVMLAAMFQEALPLFLAVAALLSLLAGAVYRAIHSARARRVFAVTVILLGILWLLFPIVGSLWPLLTTVERV